MTDKNGPEFPKQNALKRFCQEIGKHFVRGTVDNRNALRLLHKKITNVDVARLLPAGCATILLKSDSALVTLVKMFSVACTLARPKTSWPRQY